jgi:hypothetical protein
MSVLYFLQGRGGNHVDDYNQTKFQYLLAVLQGMAAGIRLVSTQPRIGINSGGWLHYTYLQMLIDVGMDFDIVSWHWYSEMGDLNNSTGPHVDVFQHLVDLGKPIWLTELNRRGGSGSYPPPQPPSEKLQAEWLTHELSLLHNLSLAQPLLQAVMIYELYDQMDIDHNISLTCFDEAKDPEACYGLVRVNWTQTSSPPSSTFTPSGRKLAWEAVHTWVQHQ